MKINIRNPTHQKPHVFSSWRARFRTVCVRACVILFVAKRFAERVSWGGRGREDGRCVVPPCAVVRHRPGWIPALPRTGRDLGQFLHPTCLRFFICKMDVTEYLPRRVVKRSQRGNVQKPLSTSGTGKPSAHVRRDSRCQAAHKNRPPPTWALGLENPGMERSQEQT